MSHRFKRVVWHPLTIIALVLINIIAYLAFFIAMMALAPRDTYRTLRKRFDAYVTKQLDDVFGGFSP